MDIFCKVNNEDGFVLVIALLILLILIVIGTAATNTSTIELQISGNEKVAKNNFYNAEASVYELAQTLENSTNVDALRAFNFTWLQSKNSISNFSSINVVTLLQTFGVAGTFGNYLAVDLGVSGGSSLDMTSASQVHSYNIYGQSSQNNGQEIIQIGYKKRF